MDKTDHRQVPDRGTGEDDLVRDVVVIGGGSAGLSAALMLARARMRVTVVDAGAPRNAPAEHIHGFLGAEGRPPGELLATARAEVTGYGGELLGDRVAEVRDGFEVRLATGRTLRTPRLLLATGMRDDLPEVPGLAERWGRDVLQCPYCHGYEVRDQPLGVLASHPNSVHQALLIRQWSDDVILFEHTRTLSADEREQLAAQGIRTVPGEVKEFVVRDGALYGLQIADEPAPVPRQALFVFPRFRPNIAFASQLGCATDERGFLVVDENGATSTPGVWAAGNVVNAKAPVVTAAGAAALAAMAIHADHVHDQTRRAVERARAGQQPGG